MSAPEITGTFAGHAFLKGLGQRHLMLLASGVRPVSMPAGNFLAREGEPARAFYLIQSGTVALAIHTPDRGEVQVQTVGPGDALGWSWLVPARRPAAVARVMALLLGETNPAQPPLPMGPGGSGA